MNLLKKYGIVSAIFLIILIAVLYRSLNHSGFRYDAPKHAESSISGSNIITEEQIKAFQTDFLIIDLESTGLLKEKYNEITLEADPVSILRKKNIKKIERHKGPVILVSSENSISARIWMLLSQKGLKNLYILTQEEDFEVLKNKFRPDSISKPEPH
jgi:hypothetical protein